jgi:hypothetical protein
MFFSGYRLTAKCFSQHQVVALNGPNGRKVFSNHPNLNLTEGYQILMGSAPRIEDVDVPLPSENFKDILIKCVHIMLQRERVADCEYFIMARYAKLSLLSCPS